MINSPKKPKIFSPPYLQGDMCECGDPFSKHTSGGWCRCPYCMCQKFELKGKLLVVTFEMIDPDYCVCKNYEDYCEGDDES